MTLTIFARIFGWAFIAVGILGFIPGITVNGLLLGIFMVNTVHNIIHIASGVIALAVASKINWAKAYFQIFGIVYALVAILGFVLNGNLFLMHVNFADNLLHVGIALIALYFGFIFKSKEVE